MKFKYFYITLFCISYTFIFSQNKILGKWIPEDKMGHIEIFKKENKYFGKIICIVDPINPKTGQPWKDQLNPDISKRERKVLNLIMMFDFEYDSKTGEYKNGYLYNVKTGRTYIGKMWLQNEKLVLRGYWNIFYKTEKWTRVIKPCN